ncbi:putative monodehydroascorbate reductase, cytoplasmic isoform 2 [Panicum miliaceum]|uniref:Monodehydroascorbate reductase, cytoplasmic isoform 2 n=1 Tax=Panicum miliaceum TaxID=4540 RepID=A0A3L6PAD6_PANMI|nr:putative monodehydroascorbate reductase, cytoplasmic isoform 2 [Panicum miliaceum]
MDSPESECSAVVKADIHAILVAFLVILFLSSAYASSHGRSSSPSQPPAAADALMWRIDGAQGTCSVLWMICINTWLGIELILGTKRVIYVQQKIDECYESYYTSKAVTFIKGTAVSSLEISSGKVSFPPFPETVTVFDLKDQHSDCK